jgi:NADH-quinone oxidoreductase subunit N
MTSYLALQTLTFDTKQLYLILPELIVILAAIMVMLVDAFVKEDRQRWTTGSLALAGLISAGISTIKLWVQGIDTTQAFSGMIVLDRLRLSFTLIFLLVSALTILISMVWVEWEDVPAGEFHSLLLFATSGMMLMASGNDLVIIFLGLEILSIATYVLAGLRRTDLRSNESSIKYFILGSFSSAFLLYGIALIYGATATTTGLPGTTNITVIAERLNTSLYPPLLFAGAALLLIGFGFKIATAPFHIWTPDVYEGAPTPVTAFMAAGPKAAGFASFLRVFIFGFPFVVATESYGGQLHSAWLNALIILAMLTMTVGNIVAIVQSNVKRLLAYSSIAHAGYAIVGFVAAGATADQAQRETAITSVIFYLLTYAIMNLGAFTIVTLIARSGDRRTEVEDYNGIGFQVPILAAMLSLFLLSLLGMPLTAGFIGKIGVFKAALSTGSPKHALFVWLVVVGVLNTAISAYYYLRLIIVMFFREPLTTWTPPRVPASAVVALVITVLGVLYLGIIPERTLNALQVKPNVVNEKVEPVPETGQLLKQ